MSAEADNDAAQEPAPLPATTRSRSPALVPEPPRDLGAYAPPRNPQENDSVRVFFKLFGLLVKHRVLIGAIIALFGFGGLVVTWFLPRTYTAWTTIQIDREATKVLRNQDSVQEHGNDPQFYTTQYELLRSRALAERAVGAMKLADDPAFLEPKKGAFASLLGAGADSDAAANSAAAKSARAIGMVRAGTQIQPVPGSRIVKVGYSANDPAIAQRVSTGLAENFVAMTLDRRFNASAYARSFLEDKLKQLKLKLEDSERQVVAYAQREGIVNVDDKLSVAGANLKALNDSLAAATADRIRKEQVWAQTQTASGASLPQVLDDKLIEKAREKRAELAAQYQDKLRLMKPDFPEMTQLRAQINEYDRQIRQQIENVKRSIKSQFEAARDQEASFSKKMESLKTEVLDLRNRSINYNILQREVDTNRTLYDGLLQQYKEVGVTGAVATNNVQIIDRAERPGSPSSPSLTLNIGVALAFGMVIAAAAVAVREFFDDTFVTPEEVEETLGLSVLGVVPMSETADDQRIAAREVLEDPHSPMAEAFRSLRTTLQFSTATGLPRVLLIVSSQPGEGKSFTSMCLSAILAQLGLRVLLVDADLRKASLHKALDLDNSVGLTSVLTGQKTPAEVVHADVVKGVTLMSSGPLPPNPAELLAGPRFASMLAEASANFDIVVIDGPPVVGLADAPVLGSLADGALLVVDSSRTRRRVVQAAVKRLQFAHTHLLGALLNKFDATKAHHSYGYGYGYGYGGSDYHSYGAGARAAARQLPEA